MFGKILRHNIDLISIVSALGILLLQLLALFRHWPWYSALLILILLRHVSLIQHNHAHLSIFRLTALNEVLGWVCFLSNGIPLEFYRIHHVKNHHRYNQQFNHPSEDWSSTFGFRGTHFPDQPIGMFYYVITFPIITICSSLIYLLRSPGSRSLKRFTASVLIITIISVILCSTNWEGFIIFFFVPWLVIFFAHGYNNYVQHSGCSMTDPYNSANEGGAILGGRFWFNIGYHIEHHINPSLHWSELPRFHKEIRQLIPPERYAKGRVLDVTREPTVSESD